IRAPVQPHTTMASSPVTSKKKSPLRGKGGMVALALMVALGIWLFADMQKPVRSPEAKPPVSDYVHLTSTEIRRVEVKRSRGGFALVKQNGKWAFESLGRFRANSEKVDTWLKGLLENADVS